MLRIRWPAYVVLAGVASVLWTGCMMSGNYRKMMQSGDPKERAKGCKLAGDSGEESAVPLLVDRLEDPDGAVRFFAQQSLRLATGKDFGYRESDSPALRAAAVARWRQYADLISKGGGGEP